MPTAWRGILCICLLVAGCSDGFYPPDANVNANGSDATSLIVDIEGPDRVVSAHRSVTFEAQAQNVADHADCAYLWTVVWQNSVVMTTEEYAPDTDSISFTPQELVPEVNLTDQEFHVRVEVLETGGGYSREGSAEKTLLIRRKKSDGDNDNNNNNNNTDNDNSIPDPNDNTNDNGGTGDPNDNDMSNENDNGSDIENGNENINENDNIAENLNDNGGGGPEPPVNTCDLVAAAEEDTSFSCTGITELTVLLPASMNVSTYQGLVRIEPTVCGGVPPYSYDWTPTTYVSPPGDMSGSSGGAVDTDEVEFAADQAGGYSVTVTVTDSLAAVDAATVNISVNNYDPLVADAGDAAVAVSQGSDLDLSGSVMGGSGSYSYCWSPGGVESLLFDDVPTNTVGETTYKFTVLDEVTGTLVNDTIRVVVTEAGGACADDDDDTGLNSANFVAFDPDYGGDGQAIIVGQSSVVLFDLGTDTVRSTLVLPADGRALAVDAPRRLAFVITQLAGQFTRSLQVIDLDNAVLGDNIGLPANVILARGMAVVPTTGDVLVTVSGASSVDGLIVVDPAGAVLDSALQNMHHADSFQQPVSVALLDEAGLQVAVVANAASASVTLVPLASITFTPDDPTGGGQPALAQVALNGSPRAVVADPANKRAVAAWNSAGQGWAQIITVTGDQSGSAGADIELSGPVIDQSLAIDTAGGTVFAALGDQVGVIDLSFGLESKQLQGCTGSALSVATEAGSGRVLIVGACADLSAVCY